MFEELISVIVPVYNVEQYVQKSLESLVKQTYRNIEILVVDDGSTDGSPAICDSFAARDDRVRVFHRPNSGVGESRQFGIDNCNGEYFATIDSDDYVSCDFVEKLYRTIKKNEADIAVCGVSCFRDRNEGKITATFMPPCTPERIVVTKELLASDYYRLTEDMILTDAWNKLFRTQFVKETNVRFGLPKMYVGSELQVCHKLALHCPVFCVCYESLFFHRNRAGSLMQNRISNIQKGFEIIMESLIEECRSLELTIQDQLGKVYYGLIGIEIQNIYYYGGSRREKQKQSKDLVSMNRSFLDRHSGQIERPGAFKVSRYSIPSFVLDNALWLDAVLICYSFLNRVKKTIRQYITT